MFFEERKCRECLGCCFIVGSRDGAITTAAFFKWEEKDLSRTPRGKSHCFTSARSPNKSKVVFFLET